MNKTNIFLIFILTIILTACGIHLRGTSGSYKLPIKTVYIQCNNVKICPNMQNVITKQSLATLVNNAESAEAVIKLMNEQTSRDPQSFNLAGRVTNYILTYQVTAQVWQNHEQIGNDIVISNQLISQYNDSTILANNLEEDNYWNKIHQNVTNQLIRRLIAFKYNE